MNKRGFFKKLGLGVLAMQPAVIATALSISPSSSRLSSLRVYGHLTNSEFVSIQPMSAPSGVIFHLEYKRKSGKNAVFVENDEGVVELGYDNNPSLQWDTIFKKD